MLIVILWCWSGTQYGDHNVCSNKSKGCGMEMVEEYSPGRHITVRGVRYSHDLKIIQGRVKDNWWRREGHRLSDEDIDDILAAEPRILVIGTGYAENMLVPESLRTTIEGRGIKIIAENTSEAVKTFNRLFAGGDDVAGAFHLTC